MGHHILVPKEGVALHINAFNFPIWGMLEKCAVNWLAGMPGIVKPATLTSFLTEAMVHDIIASGILPDGALQLICGNARDILNHVNSQGCGHLYRSASTGRMLKSHPALQKKPCPSTWKADSLNAMVLGTRRQTGSEEFNIFIKEVKRNHHQVRPKMYSSTSHHGSPKT